MDHLLYLCLVFVMLSPLFIADLWSPEGKWLTSWLLFVLFIVILLNFPFGILGQVWYLIVLIPDPCCLSYYKTNYRLMQVKSIEECSKGSILQYFRPSLGYPFVIKSLFGLFLSGRFTLVFVYVNIKDSSETDCCMHTNRLV